MENSGVCEGAILAPSCYESMEPRNSFNGSENVDHVIEDLDSYLEDIDDRLTISRMVSNSVIKGMVNAVTEEAADIINQKESEIALLKEKLNFYESGTDKVEEVGFSKCSETLIAQESTDKWLGNLKVAAEEQFQKLKKEFKDLKGGSGMKKFSSGSELMGLSGILQGKGSESEKWVEVDKCLATLKNIIITACERLEGVAYVPEESLSELKQEHEFQEELEAMVLQNAIRSLQEEFEAKLWEQKTHICGSPSSNKLGKIKELSSLRQDLDAISRSLSSSEVGQLLPYGTHEDGEEWNNAKRKDHFFRKVLSNHTSPIHSLKEGNGEHGKSESTMFDSLDSTQLKHMSKDELINYYKAEMTKMKRNNESEVQALTEEYFSLRREFLKERGPSSLRKDKSLDSLRKKIPEVISKVDDILMENEKSRVVYDNTENLCSLKDRVNTLLSENRKLKDSLTHTRNEIKCLHSQVSDASSKILSHSSMEANLLHQISDHKSVIEDMQIEFSVREEIYTCFLKEMTGKDRVNTLLSENRKLKDSLTHTRNEIKCLHSQVSDASSKILSHSSMEANLLHQISDHKSVIEDMQIEFSVREEIYTCFLKEMTGKVKWDSEDSDIEVIAVQEICEIVFREAALDAKATINLEIEDSDVESIIMLEISGIIFREAIKDADIAINLMKLRYEKETERTASLEASLLESENRLSLEIEKKEQLKKDILSFSDVVEEKEKLALEACSTLKKEKERFDLIYQEFHRLKDQASLQERLVSESSMESSLMKSKLEEAFKKIHLYEEQINKLHQNLELATEDLNKANTERSTLHGIMQEKLKIVSSVEAKEIEHKKQIRSMIMTIQRLSNAAADFECKIMENVKKNNLRLENLNFLCNSLVQKANVLKRTELVYKQKLDRRYSDLQKAEAEVDVLGDEVDVLLSLLEKIYVALDHYSPILQHYPGIMEILKLVRRELSGETAKLV